MDFLDSPWLSEAIDLCRPLPDPRIRVVIAIYDLCTQPIQTGASQ